MERAATGTLTFSNRRARDALPPDGTVLDIGVGAGAASLPLHPRCSLIVGVDSSADSLAEFQRQAAHIGAPVRTMQGDWPALANRAPDGRCGGVQPRRVQRGRPRAVRHRHDIARATARRHGVDRAPSDRVDGRPLVALPRPGSSRSGRMRTTRPRCCAGSGSRFAVTAALRRARTGDSSAVRMRSAGFDAGSVSIRRTTPRWQRRWATGCDTRTGSGRCPAGTSRWSRCGGTRPRLPVDRLHGWLPRGGRSRVNP